MAQNKQLTPFKHALPSEADRTWEACLKHVDMKTANFTVTIAARSRW